MTIKVGDRVPSVNVGIMTADGPGVTGTDTIFTGRTIAVFGLPGAFTKTCSAQHLPGFVNHADALKAKALHKGLDQLCEEGATQVYRPLTNNDIILGAVGVLQFDVAQQRLRDEYGVECSFEGISVHTARWVHAPDKKTLDSFRNKNEQRLAFDHGGYLVYLASSRVNLQMAEERNPEITFSDTREQRGGSS